MNSFRYEEPVYKTLFTKLHHLHQIESSSLSMYDEKFVNAFRIFVALQLVDQLGSILSYDTANVLGHHFTGLDFEVIDDELIVYLATVSPHPKDIDHLFKAGVWLAGEIEKSLGSTVE